MLSSRNILRLLTACLWRAVAGHGPRQLLSDQEQAWAKGEGRVFGATDEGLSRWKPAKSNCSRPFVCATPVEVIDLTHALTPGLPHTVPVKMERQFIRRRWRVIFNSHFRKKFPYVNASSKKKGVQQLVYYAYLRFARDTVCPARSLKDWLHLRQPSPAFRSASDDTLIPSDKYKLVENAEKEVGQVQQQYLDGAITNGERYNKVIPSGATSRSAWARGDEMFQGLENQGQKAH